MFDALLVAMRITPWVRLLSERMAVGAHELPLLWDMNFLLGGSSNTDPDNYVLCEINVSSVAAFPDSAVVPLVKATLSAIAAEHR